MRKVFLPVAFAFFLVSSITKAQSNTPSKAEKQENKYQYTEAVKTYLQFAKTENSNPQIYKKLGDLYFVMQNNAEAAKWYEMAVANPQDAETHFNYAQSLRNKDNIEGFKKQMELFVTKVPNDPRALAYLNKPNYLPELELIKSNAQLNPLNFNSSFADFGGIIYDNKVFFSTNRKGRKHNRINKMTGEPFSKIYKADLVNGNIENVVEVFDLNSRTNDGIVCFNANNTIAYFSSSTININNYAAKKERFKSKNHSKQQLFSAVKDAYGNWTDYKALPFCDKEATYLNPTLSPDGKFLFFASNQTGTFGGFDIWKVEIVADNSYGQPQNLGPAVNTVFDENFPFIKSEDGHLFFASQGHEGFGGYDIFEIDLKNNQSKPANIGKPFNTEKDDLAFSYYDDKQIGFLTSNRNGNFDIFKIESPKEEFFELKLTDPNTNSPISNVDVQIFDEKGNLVKTLTSDENGLIKDKVPFSKKYVVKIDNDKFEPMSTSIENSFKGIENQTFSLVKKPELIAKNTVDLSVYKTNNLLFEFNKASLSEVSKAQLDRISALMKADEQILLEIVSHTDARGSDAYNLKLSEKRAKVALNYLVSQSVDKNRVAVKPMGESYPLVDCGENCSEDEHAKNRRNEFLIVLPDGQRVLSE